MRHLVVSCLWLLLTATLSLAQTPLLTDDFSAVSPPYALTTQGWAAHSGAGTNSIQASAPNLVYVGLPTTGGSVALTTSGEDVNRALSTTVNSGSVYASMLVNVSVAQAAGDYFFHLGGATIGSTFNNRVFVRSTTGGFQLGLTKGNETPTYGATVYSLNTTYLIVLKYTLVSGTANDVSNLFVEPALGQTEPTATLTQSSTATDLTTVGTVALRQGTAANAPTLRVDYLRVGTTWASVTGGNATTGPSLVATPTTITGLTTTQGTPSAERTYTLTASGLTGDVTVSASANLEVAASSGGSFGPSLTVPVATTQSVVFVRVSGSAPAGSVSGTISNVSGSLSANVAVSGVVNSTVTGPIAISTARGLAGQSVTVQGRVTSTIYVGSRIFYVQDATGGIAVFSPSSGPDYSAQVQLGDLVTLTGPVTIFSGLTELGSVLSFSINAAAGRSVPEPPLVSLDQLANFQGQLVRVENTTIGNTTGGAASAFFAGGTNYAITQGASTPGILRINGTSELPGAGKPSGPTSITGIVDRFVSGATTAGANGIQLQPRLLTDVQGATMPTDQICGGTDATNLTPAQTFDVTTWNVEFFGADGGTVSCSVSPTSRPYDDLGPFDEARQARNVKTVLERLNSDMYVLQEVSDAAWLSRVVSQSIGGYTLQCGDRFSYYWEGDCDNNPVFLPTVLAQKVCVVYKNSTVTPVPAETKALLADQYGYGPNGPANLSTNNWSSGRLPFLFVADVTTNGVTRRVHVVGLHAKSGSASGDYNRRRQDYVDLKAKLVSDYPSANIIITGDFNDGAVTSIAAGSPSSFSNFVSDPANFSTLTASLEQQGCQTFESGSFLDHIVISNELYPAYIANSVNVQVPAVGIEGGYSSNTTSDHRPVSARFDLSKLSVPVSNPPVAITCGSPPFTLGQNLMIMGVINVNCATGSFRVLTWGGNGQPINYAGNVGLSNTDPTNCVRMVDGPDLVRAINNPNSDVQPFQLRVLQGSTVSNSFTFDFKNYCAQQPVPPINTTSCGSPAFTLDQPLRILGVAEVNCATGSFRILAEGGNGQAIDFSNNVGLSNADPTNCVRRVDGPDLVRAVNNVASDVQPFPLRIKQGNVQSPVYMFDFKQACSRPARIGTLEAARDLEVTILGNPTLADAVEVLIGNPAGERIDLRVTNAQGQPVSTGTAQPTPQTLRRTVKLGHAPGVYWLQVSTPTRSKTVKVVRQ